MSGKNKFYPKVKEAFIEAGYDYYDGDEDIKGKTRQHRRKPDYIAVKGNVIIIGEIKSPNEPPTSGSWRQQQRLMTVPNSQRCDRTFLTLRGPECLILILGGMV